MCPGRPPPADPAHRRPAGAADPRGRRPRGCGRGRGAGRGRGRPGSGPGPGEIAPERRGRRGRGCPPDHGRRACGPCSTPPVWSCTPTSAGHRCPPAAVEAVVGAAGYVDVEYDVETGARARRGRGTLAALRAAVPGAGRRAGRQQRRGRARARHDGPGRGPRGRRQPRRDGRDRGRLPAARPHRLDRAPGCARSGRPTAPACADYADGGRPRHRLHPQGPPEQLPRRGLHVGGAACPAAGRRWACRWSSTSAAACCAPDPLLPDEPDAATALARRAPQWSRPAATSCSADRRPGLVLGDGGHRRAAAPPPAGPGAARRQADPRRARGDAARAASRRSPAYLHADAVDAAPPHRARWPPAVGWRRRRRRRRGRRRRGARAAASRVGRRAPGGAPSGCGAASPGVVARVERGRCLVDLRCVPVESDADVERAIRAVLRLPGLS